MSIHPLISLQLVLVGVLFPTINVAAQTQSKPNCPDKCGNVSIPFPFGVGDDCYLNSYFKITCNDSSEPPKTYLRNSTFEVTEIRVDGQLNILRKAARNCYDEINRNTDDSWRGFSLVKFTVSKSSNKFTVTGCDSYGYLRGYRGDGIPYSAGCMTVCDQSDYVDYNSCSGSGCCQIEIPDGLYEVNVSAYSFNNHLNVSDFSPCTYAFIEGASQFNFSRHYLGYTSKDEMFPVVLDWSVEKENTSVAEACKANAIGYDLEKVPGFRCKCKPGYEGNPYLGCYDIDECKDNALNNCTHHCTNSDGGYTCSCGKWYKGDGRTDGEGCVLRTFPIILINICVGAVVIVILVGSSIYLVSKYKKKLKQQEKILPSNGEAKI